MGCKTILLGSGLAALLVPSLALAADIQLSLSPAVRGELVAGFSDSFADQDGTLVSAGYAPVVAGAEAASPIQFQPDGTTVLMLDSQHHPVSDQEGSGN